MPDERRVIADTIADNKIKNLLLVSGDAHMVAIDDGTLTVDRPTDRGEHRALHGLTRSLIANMVEGVTDGFERRLEIQGVGYRAQLKGKALEMSLGFSHPVVYPVPEGIKVAVEEKQTRVVVTGIDRQRVGQVATVS